MNGKNLAAVFFAAAIMLGLSASAGAVDGTIEINQATVLANGGHFPYTISASNTGQSYRLTGPLVVPAGGGGIFVLANYVTIDLNGFSISGPGGKSDGIFANQGIIGTTVENGTVTGFGEGVSVNDNSLLKSVHVDSNNNGVGISVGNFSVVEGCTANSNGTGIYCAGQGCLIEGNGLNDNSAFGVEIAVGPSLVLRNTIVSNTMNSAVGISAPNAQTGYGENVINGFGSGYVSGGTSMKNNVCGGALC
jgi:hypothetical protein